MAKSPSKSAKRKAPEGKTATPGASRAAAKPAPATAKKSAKNVSGNGNRASLQAQLELDTLEAVVETPAATRGGVASAAAPAPATMRELGLSAKEAWKVDLRGKRVALDEKGWREELARALGRVPAKA